MNQAPQRKISERRPFLVGIAGSPGAGKTTVAHNLAENSDTYLHIRSDDYLKSPETFSVANSFVNWESPSNIDFDLLRQHLSELRRGHEVTFSPLLSEGKYIIHYKPKQVIIVEGFVLFLDKELRSFFDLKIFFDISPETSLQRRAKRMGFLSKYDEKVVVPEYKKNGPPQKEVADIIFDASGSAEKNQDTIEQIIKKALQG